MNAKMQPMSTKAPDKKDGAQIRTRDARTGRFVVEYDSNGAASVSSSSVVEHALKYLKDLRQPARPIDKRSK